MGVRLITDQFDENAVMYDSVTDWAFGPVISSRDSASERAESFLRWMHSKGYVDPRLMTDQELEEHWADYRGSEEAIKKAQEKEDFPDDEEP